MFVKELAVKAAKDIKTIVLPEGDDDRVITAADAVLADGSVNLIILGDQLEITTRGASLGLKNLDKATIISPTDEKLVAQTAELFAELRKAKGVTLEEAVAKVSTNVSYFATLLVQLGIADGMVSGAVHTTADTILPSFQIIKTKPGRSVVSGAFFMVLPTADSEQVLVYADCAVNPNPTPEQIADIVLATDETAKQFGLDPHIAILSYSTGTSGKGADVDATVEAVEILKSRITEEKLDVKFEGPIQYDAAVDPDVAKIKLPDSEVAGKANVFVFPDLKSGNITYKAVQRSANALAIGPVLQGLRKPVNDLSRGALVEDIVNTIYLTAVQAQN